MIGLVKNRPHYTLCAELMCTYSTQDSESKMAVRISVFVLVLETRERLIWWKGQDDQFKTIIIIFSFMPEKCCSWTLPCAACSTCPAVQKFVVNIYFWENLFCSPRLHFLSTNTVNTQFFPQIHKLLNGNVHSPKGSLGTSH